MLLQQQQELETRYLMETYKRKPVAFVRGEGMRLYDDEGLEYLDFLAGVGAVSVGYGNTQVVQAMQDQAAKLVHASNYYYAEGRGELAEKLNNLLNDNPAATRSDLWKTFFANSGTEAIEGAIKIARKYGAKHLEGADTVITARRSFHARSSHIPEVRPGVALLHCSGLSCLPFGTGDPGRRSTGCRPRRNCPCCSASCGCGHSSGYSLARKWYRRRALISIIL